MGPTDVGPKGVGSSGGPQRVGLGSREVRVRGFGLWGLVTR